MKKILLVCYTFPPFPGVGGRRWAKFGKELYRSGHDLRVISFRSSSLKVQSSWTADIKSYEDRIEYFPSCYPKWLQNPKTLFEKMLYRLSLLYVKLFSRGNYYDKASFLRKTIRSEVSKKVEAGYKNIIVSCAPFKLALWVSEIKILYPEVNLIVDFRDRWTNNKVAYGFESLSKKRMDFEILSEKKVIDSANVVATVAKEMTDYLQARSNNASTQFLTIGNGIDFDDFKNVPASITAADDSGQLKLIFAGTLYNKALHHFYELIKTFDYLKEHNPAIYNNVDLEFYGNYVKEVEGLSSRHKNIKFCGTIPNNEIYEKIQKSHACMAFLTDEGAYALNTKFFEYLSQRKPIVLFSKAGSASQFILENKLGYSIEPGTVTKQLIQIYQDFTDNALIINPAFDISAYDVRNLTSQFENLLN